MSTPDPHRDTQYQSTFAERGNHPDRQRAPGSRRDHYRFRAGAWAALMSQQNTLLATLCGSAQEGVDATGPDTITARRLHEMRDFYTFMLNELVPLIERWREHVRGHR